MRNEYTGELCCVFCGKPLAKYEIVDGGYDKMDFTIHVCTECYNRIKDVIKEGQIDYLCEDRMREKGIIVDECY